MWRKLGLVVVVSIAALTLGCGSSAEKKPAAAAAPTPSIDWKVSAVTADNIKTALAVKSKFDPVTIDSGFPNDIVSIDIADENGKKSIVIKAKPSMSSWDETLLVESMGGTAIIASSQLFENPNVNAVTLEAQGEMMDQYGKRTIVPVVRIKLTKETANKIEWAGLADRHVNDPGNLYRIADDKYIHQGVLKNVKRSEVKF